MKLQVSIAGEDGAKRVDLKHLVEEQAAGLHSKGLADMNAELIRLEARLNYLERTDRWRITLRLELPFCVLAAREQKQSADAAVRGAFSALERQLGRALKRVRREHIWKRPARRARIGELLPRARDEAERERRAFYFKLIEAHLDTIYNYVRRELTYLESSGMIAEGALNVGDLVDAALIAGLEKFEKRPVEFTPGDWLYKIAIEAVRKEVQAFRRSIPENAASLEARAVGQSELEMFEFYQPDEVLALEDIVASEDSLDPAAELERGELSGVLHRAMADLPMQWRNILALLHMDDVPAERVAAILSLTEEDVERIAAAARDYLRQRLIDLGYADDWREHGQVAAELARSAALPLPLDERARISASLANEQAAALG